MDITHLTPDAEGSIEWPSFSNDKKAVVTLGAFDGMHLGHQAVIKRVVELAHQHDAFSVVILFVPAARIRARLGHLAPWRRARGSERGCRSLDQCG